jgi:hypothetical protein
MAGPSFVQDLSIISLVGSEVLAFAGGQPLAASKEIDGYEVSASVVLLPNGPTPDYQVISGNWFTILTDAVEDVGEIASAQAVKIAEKVGNTWYGGTFTVKKAT